MSGPQAPVRAKGFRGWPDGRADRRPKKTTDSASLVLIQNANYRYKRARTFLQGTVRAALPLGTRVEVELGRALVRGLITDYYQWMQPAQVNLVNEKTGKQRRLTATFDRFRILAKAAPVAKTEPAKKVQTSAKKGKADAGECEVCGCTEQNPCHGGCTWVAPDLCSSCADGSLTDEKKASGKKGKRPKG